MLEKEGDPVPADTWEKIKQVDAILFGAIPSKGKTEVKQVLLAHLQDKNIIYISPVIQLRQQLGILLLYVQ